MQIVGYDAGVSDLRYDPVSGTNGAPGAASLMIAEEGTLRRETLEPGRELSYRLGERHCAGTTDDGRHEACAVDDAPYCDVHSSTWLCAQCRGDCDLPLDSCRDEHAVYLAAFAPDLFKVGVTRHWRLIARLREQGADRGALLSVVSNGAIARQVESDIATSVGDRIAITAKVDGIGSVVDDDEWSALLSEYDPGETFEFEYGLDLDSRPVAETLAAGTILGTKGRLLLLAYRGSTYAVDLRDLVGRDVTEGDPQDDLQSSLGAFG